MNSAEHLVSLATFSTLLLMGMVSGVDSLYTEVMFDSVPYTLVQHGRPPPSFLRNLSVFARDEFQSVVTRRNVPRKLVQKELVSWAEKYNVTKELGAFLSQLRTYADERRSNITEALRKAPEAFQEINEIAENDELTRAEAFEKCHSRFQEFSPDVRRVLYSLLSPMRSSISPNIKHRKFSHIPGGKAKDEMLPEGNGNETFYLADAVDQEQEKIENGESQVHILLQSRKDAKILGNGAPASIKPVGNKKSDRSGWIYDSKLYPRTYNSISISGPQSSQEKVPHIEKIIDSFNQTTVAVVRSADNVSDVDTVTIDGTEKGLSEEGIKNLSGQVIDNISKKDVLYKNSKDSNEKLFNKVNRKNPEKLSVSIIKYVPGNMNQMAVHGGEKKKTKESPKKPISRQDTATSKKLAILNDDLIPFSAQEHEKERLVGEKNNSWQLEGLLNQDEPFGLEADRKLLGANEEETDRGENGQPVLTVKNALGNSSSELGPTGNGSKSIFTKEKKADAEGASDMFKIFKGYGSNLNNFFFDIGKRINDVEQSLETSEPFIFSR